MNYKKNSKKIKKEDTGTRTISPDLRDEIVFTDQKFSPLDYEYMDIEAIEADEDDK